METTLCPSTSERIKNIQDMYSNEILNLATKRIATRWIELGGEVTMLREISQE
jgi:hypothetical protein